MAAKIRIVIDLYVCATTVVYKGIARQRLTNALALLPSTWLVGMQLNHPAETQGLVRVTGFRTYRPRSIQFISM